MTKAQIEELNIQYLPRLTVPNAEEYLERAGKRSTAVRDRLDFHIDVSYGNTPLQSLDNFPTEKAGTPMFFFIHGGYCRAADNSLYSEAAAAMVAAGATVVLPNHDLCPA